MKEHKLTVLQLKQIQKLINVALEDCSHCKGFTPTAVSKESIMDIMK